MAAIVNPAAGRGRAAILWRRAARQLEARGLAVTASQTSGPGDGESLTREAIEAGYGTILAVGGDGTVHEIANGFVSAGIVRTDARLAILPAGTGVDFARNISIRRGVRAAVERLVRGEEMRIDVGFAGERLFVNFAETGLGAAVVEREREYAEAWPGRASYLLAALRAAIDEDNIGMRISVDGGPVYEGPLLSVVVANGRYFGGGMKIAPGASMSDGLFDVFVLGNFTRLERVSQVWKIYPGVHVGHRKVLWRRGHTVEIVPQRTTRLDLDGELSGAGPYRFEICPDALRVVV